ncbi:folate-binding protein YgfZ [Halenospora varia]|nr:folate-binding protein YgfZ [Halenospora varia]
MHPPRLPIPRLSRASSLTRNVSIRQIPQIQRPIATRFLSTTPHPNPPSPPKTAFAHLTNRRILSLTGADSTKFLNGVITVNMYPTNSRTHGFYAAFLNAPGRLLHDVFIYPNREEGDKAGWLIDVDANEVERLAKLIKKYRLRAKFDVRVLSEDEVGLWAVWGVDRGGFKNIGEGVVGCDDFRIQGMGRRLILPSGTKPDVEAEEASEGSYKVRRYLMGVPEGQDELIRESALVQESNVDFMGATDYKKGCYVGQELTIRTAHTGVIRKRVLPVMIYGKDEKAPTELKYDPEKHYGVESIPKEVSIGRVEKRGRSAGKWLAGVGNIGLALCRLETMTSVPVTIGEVGTYKEGDEFKVEWELEGGSSEMVKLKAFVPPWLLKKQLQLLEEQKKRRNQ